MELSAQQGVAFQHRRFRRLFRNPGRQGLARHPTALLRRLVAPVLVLLSLSTGLGCARGNAQFMSRTTTALDLEKTSLALLVFRSRNDYKQSSQPLVKQLIITSLANEIGRAHV